MISAFTKNKGRLDNIKMHKDMVKCLKDAQVPFKEGMGCYEGVSEGCIMIKDAITHYDFCLELAKQFNQDSLLVVGTRQDAWLDYSPSNDHNKNHYLGMWTRVKNEYNGDYTILSGVKYSCIKLTDINTILEYSILKDY